MSKLIPLTRPDQAKVEGVPVETTELRFGVRAISGRRAATWKAWTEGGSASDFYVGCRALGGEMKASFHQSGLWHIAHTEDFHANRFEENAPKPSTRFIDRWSRPAEIAPGFRGYDTYGGGA